MFRARVMSLILLEAVRSSKAYSCAFFSNSLPPIWVGGRAQSHLGSQNMGRVVRRLQSGRKYSRWTRQMQQRGAGIFVHMSSPLRERVDHGGNKSIPIALGAMSTILASGASAVAAVASPTTSEMGARLDGSAAASFGTIVVAFALLQGYQNTLLMSACVIYYGCPCLRPNIFKSLGDKALNCHFMFTLAVATMKSPQKRPADRFLKAESDTFHAPGTAEDVVLRSIAKIFKDRIRKAARGRTARQEYEKVLKETQNKRISGLASDEDVLAAEEKMVELVAQEQEARRVDILGIPFNLVTPESFARSSLDSRARSRKPDASESRSWAGDRAPGAREVMEEGSKADLEEQLARQEEMSPAATLKAVALWFVLISQLWLLIVLSNDPMGVASSTILKD